MPNPRPKGKKTAKRNALIALMRKVPDGKTIFSTLIGLGDNFWDISADRDRTAAIMGAAFLEYALKKAITTHLKHDPADPNFDYLFDSDEAPYRDFSSRIRLARAIGVISKEEQEQLDVIRHIRNTFAHSMENITFHTAAVAAYFDDLKILDDSDGYKILVETFSPKTTLLGMMPSSRASRITFAHAVFMFYWKLINYPAPAISRESL